MADPFAWMRHRDLPAMRSYLAAERRYYDQQMAPLAGLRDELAAELTARLPPADESVRWRRGAYWYFTRIQPGQQYEQFCRAGPAGQPAQVLLDENELLAGHAGAGGYLALGVREVSPDGRLLAYSADFTGDEVYQLRIRDLGTGADLPGRIGRTYYGLAWSAGSDELWYTVTDPQYRPHEVWRHRVGTSPDTDVLVYREDDERFEVMVRGSRSGASVLIETASRDTSETLAVPAASPGAAPVVLLPRKKGVEYQAEHAAGPGGGEFFLVTNDGAPEFRLVAMPATAVPGRERWTEVVAGDPATRLVRCDVFGDYLVVEQRRDAATQLRVIDRRSGEQRLIEAAGPHMSLALAVNEEYHIPAVTVRTESLIDPPAWHDVDLASGQWQLRKRQQVPGHDPGRYLTRRVTARAGDGTPVPVTLACLAGLRPDGTAPCLLYGYGAYEACEWPAFGVGVPSLLDRGFVYAVAHVRGGGEGGRGCAGDELQGIKKGILELADLIAVNKCEGDNEQKAEAARQHYANALHIMSPSSPNWRPPVLKISGLTGLGLTDLWGSIEEHHKIFKQSGELEAVRRRQRIKWMWNLIEDKLMDAMKTHPAVKANLPEVTRGVEHGDITVPLAALKLLELFGLAVGLEG